MNWWPFKNEVLLVLLLLQGILLSPGALHAATWGKIAGRITDGRTKEPLLGANVIVTGTNLGAVTDLSGDYTRCGWDRHPCRHHRRTRLLVAP